MFRSATFRLTAWYLVALMALSVVFSLLLYRSLTSELGNGLNNQVTYLRTHGPDGTVPPRLNDFMDQREQQLELSRTRVEWELVYFNILILLVGGLGSFWLARHTLKPIEDAHEAQVRFTSDASHELRTPLAAMRTELEVALRDKGLTLAESKELHVSALQELAKLEDLTTGLLKLAVHDDGRRDSYVKVPLEGVAADAAARVASAASQKEITLEIKPSGGIVHGDQWALTELGGILLDNAVKYTPKGGTITVSTSEEGHFGILAIADTGAGIAAADLPFIFNRFYRSDTSRAKTGAEGYGLGLSIAKKIVDAHGGHLEVTSAVGKGSSFKVYLPSKPKSGLLSALS